MVWLYTENQLPKLPVRASKFCMGVWVVAGGVGWWSVVVVEDKQEGNTFLSILRNHSKIRMYLLSGINQMGSYNPGMAEGIEYPLSSSTSTSINVLFTLSSLSIFDISPK